FSGVRRECRAAFENLAPSLLTRLRIPSRRCWFDAVSRGISKSGCSGSHFAWSSPTSAKTQRHCPHSSKCDFSRCQSSWLISPTAASAESSSNWSWLKMCCLQRDCFRCPVVLSPRCPIRTDKLSQLHQSAIIVMANRSQCFASSLCRLFQGQPLEINQGYRGLLILLEGMYGLFQQPAYLSR